MKMIIMLLFVITLIGCQAITEDRGFEKKQAVNTGKVRREDNQLNSQSRVSNRNVDDESQKQSSNNVTKDNSKIYKLQNEKKILDVPLIEQNPELKYGCEVTSLAMLLQYAGFEIDKLELAYQVPKDNSKLIQSESGNIIRWGDPNKGFVGDMTGKQKGYAVYDKPLEELMRKFLGYKTLNLTGKSFNSLLKQIDNDRPVIVWTTGDYQLPDRWESWKYGNGEEIIKTPLDLHVVVLVGYDGRNVYLNDPLSGVKAQKVRKQTFINSWKALGKRALSYQ